MKVKEIFAINDIFKKLYDKELPISAACSVAQTIKNIEIPMAEINKRRDDIIRDYADKDEFGNILPDENGNIKITQIDECNAKLIEFSEEEIGEIEIKPLQMYSLEGLNLSPKDILPIIDYIIE